MVINPDVLGKFGCQVWKKYVHKVDIFVEDLCKSVFGNQTRYLRFPGRVDIEWSKPKRRNKWGRTKRREVTYIGLIF